MGVAAPSSYTEPWFQRRRVRPALAALSSSGHDSPRLPVDAEAPDALDPGYCCSSLCRPGSSSNGSAGSSCGAGSSHTETTFKPLAIFRMSESLE